ncbi:MAG: TonB-dependent receptor [Pseudomonadota bacterium]
MIRRITGGAAGAGFLSVFAVVCAYASALLPQPAQAQEPANRAVLEEVVVTARKVEESVQDVPIAITAITEDLNQSSIRNLEDLNGFAPNVSIDTDGSRSNGASITIRGISPTRTDDNSFDAPVAVMIDGIYLGSLAGQVLENFDMERVEVLRGPQGTLFGRNTVGGVVHVIRSRPNGELDGRFKATAGEDGQREFRGVLNFPILQDTLAGKVFLTKLDLDGYYENITLGNDGPKKDYLNYGLTLLATPTDNFEATLTVERFDDDSQLNAFQTNMNFAPGVAAPPQDAREVDLSLGTTLCAVYQAAIPGVCRESLDIPNFSENDTEQDASLETNAVTLNMSLNLNDNLSVVSVTGYRDQEEYRISDFDGSRAPFITIERWNDFDQFSQELRLEGQWDRASLVAGYYYWNNEFTQDWVTGGQFWATLFGGVAYTPALWQACQGTNGLDGLFAPISCDLGLPNGVTPGADVTQILFETQETTANAFFAQFEYDLTDRLAVNAGLRWTKEEKDFMAGQSYLSNVERQRLRNFPGFADLSNSWKETTFRFGATYRLNEEAIVYASYSEGFHSGGFFGVNQNIRDFERDQYDPEFAKSWEIGLKSQLAGNRLRLNAAYFNNDFSNKQESFVQFDPDTRTVATVFENAGSATYQGIEAEAQFAATPNLLLFANIGWLDAEYDDFVIDVTPTDDIDNPVNATFLKPRNASDYTLGLGFDFSQQIGPGELQIYAKYSIRDDYETNVLNLPVGRVDSSDTEDLSAAISYRVNNLIFSVFGRNLTDSAFEVPTVLGGNAETPSQMAAGPLFIPGTINRPRSFGLELEYSFGANN